ncbi:MAG TPA: hypothetical protein VMK65_12405 [Longimicrobiales bacterium]|nr:hypothetical protein [Longimicrobiales bacterium]
MQFQIAVSHIMPTLAQPLVEGLRRIGARVIEDPREQEEVRHDPLFPAPVTLFISHEYLAGLTHPAAAERYRLLKWAIGDAVTSASRAPRPRWRPQAAGMPEIALSLTCVFSRGELASFLFRPGRGERVTEQALERMFSVLEACSRTDDSLLLRARERLGTKSWRIMLRFDDRQREWVPAGIVGAGRRQGRTPRQGPLPAA